MVDKYTYNWFFQLHWNKTEADKRINKLHGVGVTIYLVLDATKDLPTNGEPYCLFVDNYYGSIELAEKLEERGMYFTLGCRENCPAWLWKNGLHDCLQNGGHPDFNCFAVWKHRTRPRLAMTWDDKNKVNILTNQYGTEPIRLFRHKRGSGRKYEHVIPEAIYKYNKHMGYVDNFNSYLNSIGPKHRNWVWRRAHFLAMLRFALINVHVILQALQDEYQAIELTLIEAAEELVMDWRSYHLLHACMTKNYRNRRYRACVDIGAWHRRK